MSAPVQPEHTLPHIPAGTAIPKVIHQTYSRQDLPKPLAANVSRLRDLNPSWEHRLYDDEDIARYVRDHFGARIAATLDRLAPEYSVARSDVFRYMLMYREGGVYLDIKSYASRPLDVTLPPSSLLVTAQWGEGSGRAFGRHRELRHLPGGEYQQWHIAAAPGHPILRRVLIDVLGNIETYSPWRFGVGKKGVLAVTGPIAYTKSFLAIGPSPDVHVARSHEDLGLEYSVVKDHTVFFGTHYSRLDTPVVPPRTIRERVSARLFREVRRIWLRLQGVPAPERGGGRG